MSNSSGSTSNTKSSVSDIPDGNTNLIIGTVVLGTGVVGFIILLIVIVCVRKKRKRNNTGKSNTDSTASIIKGKSSSKQPKKKISYEKATEDSSIIVPSEIDLKALPELLKSTFPMKEPRRKTPVECKLDLSKGMPSCSVIKGASSTAVETSKVAPVTDQKARAFTGALEHILTKAKSPAPLPKAKKTNRK